MKRLFILFFAVPLLVVSSIPMNIFAQDNEERTIHDEIVYNVLVDRFNNGRQAQSDQVDIDDPLTYTGGDIQGIIDRLSQIKEAGFTAISISPIMENAAKGYHGYWVEDFYKIEEEFGDLDDLKTLVKEAHEQDINIILELDLNYVAKTNPLVDEHPEWFTENEIDPIPATEWLHDVVVFDQTNQEAQAYLMDVASYWMTELDIDGYTLHAADQSNIGFIEKVTANLKEKDPTFYILATTLQGEKDVADLIEIDSIDGVTNATMFEAMNDVLTKSDQPISEIYNVWETTNQEKNILYVDNMNTPRFSNNFADNGRTAATTWNIALAYLYFTPGIPFVYQGSEIPMYGPGFPESQYMIDFASADKDLEKAFEKMASIYKEFPAVRKGDFELIGSDKGFSLFKRTYKDETVYIGINNDSESRVVEMDGLGEDLQLKGLLHDDTVREHEDGKLYIGLERESSEVFVVRPNTGLNWGFIGFVLGILFLFVAAVIILKRKQAKREKKEN